METLTGELQFVSLWQPIKLLDIDCKETDLREIIWKVFTALNGCPTTMKNDMNMIEIFADPESKRIMEFDVKDDGILIALTEGNIGFTNISAYLSDMLERLNSMELIITVGEKSIRFEHDTDQSVFELKYTDGNSCKLTGENIKEICKVGTKDCCIFVSSGSQGFMCEKFGFFGRQLLNRYSKGEMNATRVGNCKIIGRIKE